MNRLERASAALCVLMLSGCVAIVETQDGSRHRISSDAFREYAETVFREQNRVASELVFGLEDAALEAAQLAALEQAELALLTDCRELNEIAVRRRDGERRRWIADARAAKTVPVCERAVDAVKRTLAQL